MSIHTSMYNTRDMVCLNLMSLFLFRKQIKTPRPPRSSQELSYPYLRTVRTYVRRSWNFISLSSRTLVQGGRNTDPRVPTAPQKTDFFFCKIKFQPQSFVNWLFDRIQTEVIPTRKSTLKKKKIIYTYIY